MPALLLSSASGTNASNSGLSLLPSSTETAKTSVQSGSFGESLSASMSSLVKLNQTDQPQSSLDTRSLSATLEDLSAQLDTLDPALFEDLRRFLNGQDLSSQGLEALQAGGELPDFLANIQAYLQSQTDIQALSDTELAALESSFSELSALISSLARLDATDKQFSQNALPGMAFIILKDGNGQNAGANSAAQNSQVSWQKYDPQQLSQNAQSAQAVQADPYLNSMNGSYTLVTESDKAFNTHLESMKFEIPADLGELADSVMEAAQEGKDKSSVSKFSELQLRTLNESIKPYSTTLNTPVNAKEWADEVSQKIVWFTGRNIQAAEMHLNPADLGPIDVKINVQNDVASVTFNVQNASVRELLESNVVRLREMMESNGVNLGDVNVDSGSKDTYGEAQNSAQQRMAANGSDGGEFWDEESVAEQVSVKSSNLVDYFV